MQVVAAINKYYYVMIDWGHVILEEKDNLSISPNFSSTSSLQEGRLCLAYDVKNLVYLLFFVCGRTIVLQIWVLTKSTNKDKIIIRMNLCERILTILYILSTKL
jgi:hypothetical protein